MVLKIISELRMQVGNCPKFIGLNLALRPVDRSGLAGDKIGTDTYLKTIYQARNLSRDHLV